MDEQPMSNEPARTLRVIVMAERLVELLNNHTQELERFIEEERRYDHGG